jgi:hypothetical protein
LKVDLKNAHIKKLASQGSTLKMVEGQLSLNTDFATQGKSMRDMMSGLNGKLGFSTTNGKINGLDLNAIAKQIGSLGDWTSVLGLLRTSQNGGQTEFRAYDGEIFFDRGAGSIRSMKLSADAIETNITGMVDLANFKLDTRIALQLTEHRDWPIIGLRLVGPIDAPKKELDTTAIQNHLVRNVFSNVLKNVISGRTGEVQSPTDILNKILTKPQAPTPTPTPSDPSKKPDEKKPPSLIDLLNRIPKR